MSPVPKVIWMLWLQGWDAAPPLAKACLSSWQRANPGWEVRALDASDISHAPSIAALEDRLPAARSDIARVQLLREHGGVWADATTFCVRPLDDWLPGGRGRDFFAFKSPGYGRRLSSWFLAAAPGSYIARSWCDRVDGYWAGRSEADAYFWFHHLFDELHSTDPTFRRAWAVAGQLPVAGPHYFSPYDVRFTGPMQRSARARLAARRDPLYKLTLKIGDAKVSLASALQYFVDGGARPLQPAPRLAELDRAWIAGREAAKQSVNRMRTIVARL